MRAAQAVFHSGDFHLTRATAPERRTVPRLTLWGLVHVQLTCASSDPAVRAEMVVRGPKLRSDRVLRIWSVGSAQLVGSEAQQLGDSTLAMPFAYVGGRVDVDVRPCLVGRARRATTSIRVLPSMPAAVPWCLLCVLLV